MTFIPFNQPLKCFAPCPAHKVESGQCHCHNRARNFTIMSAEKKKPTYTEAQEILLRVPWKVEPCHQGESCWCRMIVPANPIECEGDEDVYVSGAGELSKIFAEHIVELHNASLPKTLIVPVLKIGVENANGRIYTEKAAEQMMGQLDHPNRPILGEIGMRSEAVVSLTSCSQHVKNLENDNGKRAYELLTSGAAVLRPRSIGTVNPDKTVELEQLIAFDIIPKCEDAFRDLID